MQFDPNKTNKTNIGGIAQTVKLTAIHIVTEMPRSADVIAPICFFPLLQLFWMVFGFELLLQLFHQ